MSVDMGQPRPRLQLLDLLRGVAILAMIAFHIAWDLYYFGFSPVDVTTQPGWVAFQKSILTSFLLLVGAGLVLAHGNGIRWKRFWRRWSFVVAGALAVTAGTYWMFPDYFVFFGVLHAIAAFSLIGLAFLRLPWLVTAAIGAAVIAANFLYNDSMFANRELGWIGFWPTSPPTSDVVPFFPWLGVTLLGIAWTKLLMTSAIWPRVAGWYSPEPIVRGLAFIGRWSLLVYLLHQPLIIGALYGISMLQAPVLAPPVLSQSEGFTQSCNQSCGAAPGRPAGYCERYCACALEQVEAGDLWDNLSAPQRTPEQETALQSLANLCTAMASTPGGS